MNSFALLQDDVEDDGATVTQQSQIEEEEEIIKPSLDRIENAETPEPNGREGDTSRASSNEQEDKDGAEGVDIIKDDIPEKEKDLTFEEYLAKKAALSNSIAKINIREGRRANDGQDGFAKMNKLKKKVERTEGLSGVPVKEMQEAKGLKDSTHAAVARNAEIQKFFQRDPDERRPSFRGRGRGVDRGRGRGGYERGRGGYERGRGGYERGRGGFERGRGSFERGRGGFDRGGRGGYDRGGRGGFDRGGRGGFERGGRGGSGERGGRGSYERGEGEFERGRGEGGRGRGRGGFRDGPYRSGYENRSFPQDNDVVAAPNVDDISAFPSL